SGAPVDFRPIFVANSIIDFDRESARRVETIKAVAARPRDPIFIAWLYIKVIPFVAAFAFLKLAPAVFERPSRLGKRHSPDAGGTVERFRLSLDIHDARFWRAHRHRPFCPLLLRLPFSRG